NVRSRRRERRSAPPRAGAAAFLHEGRRPFAIVRFRANIAEPFGNEIQRCAIIPFGEMTLAVGGQDGRPDVFARFELTEIDRAGAGIGDFSVVMPQVHLEWHHIPNPGGNKVWPRGYYAH